MAQKPRLLQSRRDLVLTMVPLVVLCLIAALASGNVKLGFGADPKDETVTAIDAASLYRLSADNLGFGVRMPAGPDVTNGVPQGWKATASRDEPVDGGTLFNVNYVTPEKNSLQFTQTDAPAASAVESVYGARGQATGTIGVGGRTWAVYGPNEQGRSAWSTEIDGTALVLSGGAQVPRFSEFASAVQDQPPLPKRSQTPPR